MTGKDAPKAREGAFEVLMQVESGAFANLALDSWLGGPGKGMSAPDTGLLTELVTGVVKRRLTLDYIIDRRVSRASRLETGPRTILRLGLYQLVYLDRVPARAATYEAVEFAAKRYHRGVASLVNGVMRGWLRDRDSFIWPDKDTDPEQYLSVYHSHPRWLVSRWLGRYGFTDTQALCRFDNAPADLWIRTNTLKVSRDELYTKLGEAGRESVMGCYAPEALRLLDGKGIGSLASYREGLFTVQDESSMMAAHGLGPLPGHRVLDMCAAPGGKTTHMAQLMGDSGSIEAWDLHPHRVSLIRSTQRRLGIRSISAKTVDATADLLCDPVPAYDRILVDAPCSGLGVLRRRADARWRRAPEDIPRLADIQTRILKRAMGLLLPGGRLLYCTCTTEPEENAAVIDRALYGQSEVVKGRLALPVQCEDKRSILPAPADWDIQFMPFVHGMEGLYMAVLERSGQATTI